VGALAPLVVDAFRLVLLRAGVELPDEVFGLDEPADLLFANVPEDRFVVPTPELFDLDLADDDFGFPDVVFEADPLADRPVDLEPVCPELLGVDLLTAPLA
jgi:hypothetical protein